MADDLSKSICLVARINVETETCLRVLGQIPQPARRNAIALDTIEAKLDAAGTKEERQVCLAERSQVILDRESGLKEATRDWHNETDAVVKELATFLKHILKEMDSHVTKRNSDTNQTDFPNGPVQDASPSTPTMPTPPVFENNQTRDSSIALTALAAGEVSDMPQMTCHDLRLTSLAIQQEKDEPWSSTYSKKTTTQTGESNGHICPGLPERQRAH